MLETCKVAQFPFQAGQDVQLADWGSTSRYSPVV